MSAASTRRPALCPNCGGVLNVCGKRDLPDKRVNVSRQCSHCGYSDDITAGFRPLKELNERRASQRYPLSPLPTLPAQNIDLVITALTAERQVRIDVRGGVAYVDDAPCDISAEIVDHDNH